MTEGIYFADAELPFHVWVRERGGTTGFRWVLREARGGATSAPADADSQRAPGGADGSADGAREP